MGGVPNVTQWIRLKPGCVSDSIFGFGDGMVRTPSQGIQL